MPTTEVNIETRSPNETSNPDIILPRPYSPMHQAMEKRTKDMHMSFPRMTEETPN